MRPDGVHNRGFQTNAASSEDHESLCKGRVNEMMSVLFDLKMKDGEMKKFDCGECLMCIAMMGLDEMRGAGTIT